MKKAILLLMVLSINSVIVLTAQSTQKYCAPVTINPQPNVEKATFDQSDLKAYYINYQNSLADEFDGSYQFILSGNSHTKLIITTETLDLINLNRDKKEEKLVDVATGIKIRILSKKSIRTKKTIPLDQLFIFE